MSSTSPLVVLADDWGRHPSSCQHLIKRVAPSRPVLWVNTVGTRQPKANTFTFRRGIEKLRNWSKGLTKDGDVWVLDVPMLPISKSFFTGMANRTLVTRRIRKTLNRLELARPIVLTTLPYVTWLVGNLDEVAYVYNCTDDYSHWPGADVEILQEAERATTSRADLVLAASQALQDLHAKAKATRYFPHAVDVQHFRQSKQFTEMPKALGRIEGPRVGFFGLIYEKIDFELLNTLAEKMSDVQLVMIGPEDVHNEALHARPNVHFMGKVQYHDLPSWIGGLDVLLMPYRQDDPMIQQSNPLKLRECLATGIPTVSVKIPEVERYVPHVRVGRNHDDFVAETRKALAEGATNADARMRSVINEDWETRADELTKYLKEVADA